MPKLTKRTIDAVVYEGDGTSRHVLWDDSMPGFGCRIYPSGKKAFILSYRDGQGRKRLYTVGRYGRDLTLEQARTLATQKRGEIVGGTDPLQVRRQERAVAQSGDTFEGVAKLFMERYVKARGRKSEYEFQRIIDKELCSRWGKRKISEIGHTDVLRMLDDIADRAPIMSNRVLGIGHKLFAWAVERHIVDDSPFHGVRKVSEERQRDRVLDDGELRFVWDAAAEIGWPRGSFLHVLMLLGQRRGEVAAMKWRDLDLDGPEPTWTLPREATKADRRHVVPLSPQAVEIIDGLHRMEDGIVFSFGHGHSVGGFSRFKAHLDKLIAERCEKEGHDVPASWTFHDIRRTCASGMARLNVSPHILSRVLNHAAGAAEGITAIYNRHSYADEQRHALNAWGAHVERIVAGKDAANVVELHADAG